MTLWEVGYYLFAFKKLTHYKNKNNNFNKVDVGHRPENLFQPACSFNYYATEVYISIEWDSLTDFMSTRKQLHVTWRIERKPSSWKISGKTFLFKYLFVVLHTFVVFMSCSKHILYTYFSNVDGAIWVVNVPYS